MISHRRLHGCRRYDSMDGIGRVESGTETESDAGKLTGRKWLLTSGKSFPAKAEDTENTELASFLLCD